MTLGMIPLINSILAAALSGIRWWEEPAVWTNGHMVIFGVLMLLRIIFLGYEAHPFRKDLTHG